MEVDPILALLDRRKNKAIRVILGTRERLFEDPDGAFRKVVLDEVNALFDEVRDILLSLQEDREVVVNQLYLDKLDAILQKVS